MDESVNDEYDVYHQSVIRQTSQIHFLSVIHVKNDIYLFVKC